MSPKSKLSLLAIEQEVEAQAREWHRARLQKRLQQVADEQGALCPHTGQPLQEARYEPLSLDTCVGKVVLRAHYGRHPKTGEWQDPIRLLWGLKPYQVISPQLEDRISYTAAQTDSYGRAAKMANKWGTPIAASTIHKHAQLMGQQAQAQAKEREEQLHDPHRQAQAIAPLPNGLEVFCLVVMMDGFMARKTIGVMTCHLDNWHLTPGFRDESIGPWHARCASNGRAGGYHVTARGNERQDIFGDDADHFHFFVSRLRPLPPAAGVGLARAAGPVMGLSWLAVRTAPL